MMEADKHDPNITCAVLKSPATLSRTSCSGHERDRRRRCRTVRLLSRAEPGLSSTRLARIPWLSSSRAAARSSSSRLHSRAKLFTVGTTSESDSDWDWKRHERPEPETSPGGFSPLAWQLTPAEWLPAMTRLSARSSSD
ncbi:unnamed protein product [Pleuronectes platessa]|uniref:Uncharacterized protein n=1 Tax=Pleuronectes platessa TaxID=8262 RepID=A0A9N7Z4L2_PLEPL|nr:unnamed protein product [Pleuronectes platessa]